MITRPLSQICLFTVTSARLYNSRLLVHLNQLLSHLDFWSPDPPSPLMTTLVPVVWPEVSHTGASYWQQAHL